MCVTTTKGGGSEQSGVGRGMTTSIWCGGWDGHEHCSSPFCQCECHIQGREEWAAWQHHVAKCHWCRDVVRGVRLGRCNEGNELVAAWNVAIH